MPYIKDNIVYGDSLQTKITENYGCFAGFALDRFKEIGNNIILIDGVTGDEFSGNQLYENTIKLASYLHNLGVKEGDVVGILSENRVEFTTAVFATFFLNAAVAPLNVTYTEREILHAVNLSQPKVFFTSAKYWDKVSNAIKRVTSIKHVILFDNNVIGNVKYFWSLLRAIELISVNIQPRPTNIEENVALIMCSSGTTGLPKGVQLTQKNIMSTLDHQFEYKMMLEDATVLSVIPWFHAFGCLTMIIMCCVGARFIYLPKFEEHIFLNAIQKYKVNAAFMVPPLMVFLAKHPLVDKYDLSSLMVLLCGAAPLSKETEDAVKRRIGVPFVRQGYGLSESTLSLLVQTDEFCKPGSVGMIKSGVCGKVIDIDTGKPLGPNQQGELCFKGDCIMKGYIGDEKSTQTTVDKDGWLHTGDIGYYDEDLEFFIVDRIKELIKYKAFQVPPAEIESILLTHPKVRDAAVIGLPDEECGELPLAFVVKQPNTDLSEKDVIKFIADRTSPAKRLHGGVRFVNEIPKNPSGKILRRVLKEKLKETIKSKL